MLERLFVAALSSLIVTAFILLVGATMMIVMSTAVALVGSALGKWLGAGLSFFVLFFFLRLVVGK